MTITDAAHGGWTMSRKLLMVSFCAAALFSLMPNTARAECDTEAQCEAELFPYSAESEADWSFAMSVAPNANPEQCLDAQLRCQSQCQAKGGADLSICWARNFWNPLGLAICQYVAMMRQARCFARCQLLSSDCIRFGVAGPNDPFNRTGGSGDGCGLSAEYSQPCGWTP
jgi:hypothetical protein